jgi:predicted amidohydrolase
MRACLIPLRTESRNIQVNQKELEKRLADAVLHRPDLICLPECSLTGYLYEEKDFDRFAEPVPGPLSAYMAGFAKANSIYFCGGLLEHTQEGVYNTALLFDSSGNIILHHRKVEEKPPFLCGKHVQSVDTDLGRMSVLICGDMFNEQVIGKIDRPLDFILMPMSRSFAGKSPDTARWDAEERQVYLDAVRAASVTTLIVNALELLPEESTFGGALAVRADGTLLSESPHGTDELLIVDL